MIQSAWLGAATENTACVVARSTTTGTVRLTSTDASFSQVVAAADTGVNDGVARLDISGLQAGRRYPAIVSFDGDGTTKQVTLRTMRSDRFRCIVASCMDYRISGDMVWENIVDEDIDAFIFLGDFGYQDNTGYNRNGEGIQENYRFQYSNAQFTTNQYEAMRLYLQIPAIANAMSQIPCYFMFDDHEIYDGWDWTLKNINDDFIASVSGAVEQIANALTDEQKKTALRDCYNIGRGLFNDYLGRGNPVNTDTPIDSDPAAAYFRFRIGNLIEIYVLDELSYRDRKTTAHASYTEPYPLKLITDRSMLGDTGKGVFDNGYQRPWLQNSLADAEADGVTFKLICSPKKTHVNATDNDDTWVGYTTERDSILKYIAQNITSCAWAAGDRHDGTVIYRNVDETIESETVNTKHICVVGCPFARANGGVEPQQGAGYQSHIVWKQGGNSGYYHSPANGSVCDARGTAATSYHYTLIDVTPERMKFEIKDGRRGNVLWDGQVNAGENGLAENLTKVGF